MTKSYHVCIHGAGGLGSVIGGYLAQTGQKVTLIGRQPHMDAINKDGLLIQGIRGNVLIKDNLSAVTRPEDVEGEIDYYILLTKAKGATSALNDAKVLRGQVVTALTLQNGINKEAALQQAFGKESIIGASIMEAAYLAEPGIVQNSMTVPTTAYFGELEKGSSSRTERLAELFNEAGLGAKSVVDIQHVLWEKIVQVGGASAWSASTLSGMPNLDYGDGLSVRAGAEHYVTIAKELLELYKKMGYKPQNFYTPISRLVEIDNADFEDAVKMMMEMGKQLRDKNTTNKLRTSMHEDILAGRKSEVDVILKPLCDAAQKHMVPVPTFMGAYRVIKTLDGYLN